MAPTSPPWWSDDRVYETVTSAYVHSHLRPNEQELLQRPLYFGGDLTDDTYLDWILTRAKRFFLILVATGVPDQIFGIVDDSYDDEDLPVIEQAIPDLRLSFQPDRSLDKRFYKNQFRFLTRVVGEGEHIRYADEETIPVIPLSLKTVVLPRGNDGTDRVRLPSEPAKTVLRRRIVLDSQWTEEDILMEIATSRRLCHEHISSVFGSYLHQGAFNVLSLPAAEWSLKTFLTDTPKAFNALSKVERRHHLINWPHCLANALTWLHKNGEFHGAIRPSNIQIDSNFRICLGLLDGDGLLRDSVRSDDIEAYQYAPPERWKRAVTVQNTGSATVSLPSGGRSGRKMTGKSEKWNSSDGDNSVRARTDSIAAAYTFQPTSRGNYARLRLSAAMGPDAPPQPTVRGRNMRSPTDNKSVSTQATTRPKPASVISSTGSSGRNIASSFRSNPMFISAPEGRSAVVQTWQSVEQDMFTSDIFSLGAVILDILTILCKRSYSSFARHRSAKNRNAGRGGGLADASFHANLGQVFLWAQSLQNEAEKKAKKDESQVYHAVGPVVQLTLQCLERDPATRLTSEKLEQKLEDYICRFSSIASLHCAAEKVKEPKENTRSDSAAPDAVSAERSVKETSSHDRLRQPSPNPRTLAREWRQEQQRTILPDAQILQSPISDVPSSRGMSVSTTPATTSASSLASFNFDGLSDTVVGESPRSRDHSRKAGRRRDNRGPRHVDVPWSEEQERNNRREQMQYWNTWHQNDSEVDPRLSFGESIDAGAFTFVNYSTSASSEEGAKYFPRPPSIPAEPPTKAPNRALPPVPPIPNHVRPSRSNQRLIPILASREELALLSHFSNAAAAGHPLRVDSLPKELNDDEDDYQDILQHTRRPHTAKTSSRSKSRQDYEHHYRGRQKFAEA
ncbi:hypothetical protein LTR84_002809 [Exophiala bonariae]|uniref:Protein kinase domain-containing protein n=1 Tax=Exophiala bonariae TaxID=1690606 RepID=A0AAV9NCS4_9EURO|nr:hypothetical protein LTR84_002809 [Exophiala bonariae]